MLCSGKQRYELVLLSLIHYRQNINNKWYHFTLSPWSCSEFEMSGFSLTVSREVTLLSTSTLVSWECAKWLSCSCSPAHAIWRVCYSHRRCWSQNVTTCFLGIDRFTYHVNASYAIIRCANTCGRTMGNANFGVSCGRICLKIREDRHLTWGD